MLFLLFQCNSKLTDKLRDAEVQLKQQPASTHTMQAILEAKVIYLQRLKQSSIRPPLLIVIDTMKVASL